MEKLVTDICIVGAGPAGTTTSITLAKMGIPHVIVDAAEFPRDKICGDAIDLNVVRVLNAIAPDFVSQELQNEQIFSKAGGLRFITSNLREFQMMQEKVPDQLPKPLFYVSKRQNFDNLFVKHLDQKIADVRFGTKIEKIERDGDVWRLSGSGKTGKIEIQCKMLVGADGDHSIVLRHLGERKIDRVNYAGAVRQYWAGVEGTHPDRLIEMYFPKTLPLSYFWIFPLPHGEANVGYGMASAYIAKHNINVRKAFDELIRSDPFLAPRFKNAKPMETVKGWGLPMSGSNRKAAGNGWLLVGDAASIICPTTGEGVGSGMISGYTAAHFLKRAYDEKKYDEAVFNNYNREIHKRLRSEERLFRLINQVPAWAFTAGVNAVLGNKFLQRWVVKNELQKWIDTAYTKPIQVDLN